MKKSLFLCSLLVLSLSLVTFNSAHAYFIRPFIDVTAPGGPLDIDGLIENGSIQSSQSFTASYQSEVDLAEGTVRTFLSTPAPVGGFAQVGGSFGDTLTFTNANPNPEIVTLDFAYEGLISTGPGTSSFVSTFATLFVHDLATGAEWDNFNTVGGPITSDSLFDTSLSNTGSLANFSYFNQLSASFTLGAGSMVIYDVFSSLSTVASGSTPVTMDFLNTGQFGFTANPGVTFTSESGVFLTATGPTSQVPEAATMLLLGSGLICLAGIRRKFKK